MMQVTVFMAVAALVASIMAAAKPDWVPVAVATVLIAVTVCLLVLPK